jgi:hypothetical protein
MDKQNIRDTLQSLPPCAAEYIARVVRKVRYRKKVRRDIEAELTAHFEDELRDCTTDEERDTKARRLIEEFGDPKLLAILCRRAKKRCRPLWKKAVVRTMQACGVLLLYIAACMVPLFIGRPVVKTDYVRVMNETVRAGRAESDNAKPFYDRAVELYVEQPKECSIWITDWPGDFNDAERRQLAEWLGQNTKALDALREGSRRPCYWSNYVGFIGETSSRLGVSGPGQPGIPEPQDGLATLAKYRTLSFALESQINYEAYTGQTALALDDCLSLGRLADHLLGHGLVIEQLVGMAIANRTCEVLLRLLDRLEINANLIAETQRQWQERLDRQGLGISFDEEKILWYDKIQRTFTDSGEGGGHTLIRWLPYSASVTLNEALWQVLTFRCPSRREVTADTDQYYSRLRQLLSKPPWQSHQEGITEANWQRPLRTSLMLATSNHACYHVVELNWHRRTHEIGVLTTLALKRYRMEHRTYPADLQELVAAGYLRDLPQDPYAPGPLSYRKTDDGFLLYSWDENFADDGGKRPSNVYGGREWRWTDNADWVFWPVTRSSK